MKNKRIRILYKIALISILSIVLFLIYLYFSTRISIPKPENTGLLNLKVNKRADDFYTIKNSWFKKSETGLWELYVEGRAFERGVITGKLTKEHVEKQERYFLEQIDRMIPSRSFLHFLRVLVAWFNRNLDKDIIEEYKLEIFGVSRSASDKYDFIGPKYQRMLNYHAAHDVGHAVQNLGLVGCTAFSVWDNLTYGSSILVGRNFDFYAGDEFANDKIVAFVNPEKGYKFVMITWGGMIGVVSGMNEKGLTVTLNAAQTKLPKSSATPISLVAREILQYAGNINQAFAIAKKREVFVSETILIGSCVDKKTVIIEKTPERTELYQEDINRIIITNHFLNYLNNDTYSDNTKPEQSSLYRYKRVKELLKKYKKFSYKTIARILRDQKGLNDKNIGMANEKAINQLIAHHSIIFDPVKKIFWISTNPFQLNKYIAYDLNKVFRKYRGLKNKTEIYEKNLTITADPFLFSPYYKNFIRFKKIKNDFNKGDAGELINEFIDSNPESYLVYKIIGEFYLQQKKYTLAKKYFYIALSKEIARSTERESIKKDLMSCDQNLK